MLNDKKKLNNIGAPIKLISHDVYAKPNSVDVILYFSTSYSFSKIKWLNLKHFIG